MRRALLTLAVFGVFGGVVALRAQGQAAGGDLRRGLGGERGRAHTGLRQADVVAATEQRAPGATGNEHGVGATEQPGQQRIQREEPPARALVQHDRRVVAVVSDVPVERCVPSEQADGVERTTAARGVIADLTHKGAIYGILSGATFAIAAGTIRQATKLVPDPDFWIRGISVLACMNTIQVVLMGVYLYRRDRPQLGKVWVNWRSSIWVGIFSVLGSAGWALAMTLENAALVRAVGQIELVFTFIASHLVLKERPSAGEWIGSVAVVGGVVLILIGR